MNFKQLECFVKLAETLNFSETADLLYMTQPAVTHLIKNLEEELDITLFVRNKRSVTLTPSGMSFYKDVKDILTKTNIAVAKAKKVSKECSPTISIGYYGTFFELEYLPYVIREFHKKLPKVQLYLRKLETLDRKEDLLANKQDILFTQPFQKNNPNIVFRPLLKGNYSCILPRNHKLEKESSISIDQLAGSPLIFLNPVQCTHDISELNHKILSGLSTPTPDISYADSPMDGYLMAKSGLGIAIMPSFIFEKDYDVSIVPLDAPIQSTFGIAYLKNDTRPEILQFIECAEQCIADKAWRK